MLQASVSTWTECQHAASEILAEGLFALRSKPPFSHTDALVQLPGVYLISSDGVFQYTGEAKDLRARIKQQFTVKTSTFYKTFCKSTVQPCEISAFRVQMLEVGLGRKELEEFVMVNTATPLNKFHRGKWASANPANNLESWQGVQTQASELLREGKRELFAQPLVTWPEASAPAAPGIYLVQAEGYNAPLYVGEGSSLFKRLKAHSTTTYFSALRRHIGTEILGFTLQTLNVGNGARATRPRDSVFHVRELATKQVTPLSLAFRLCLMCLHRLAIKRRLAAVPGGLTQNCLLETLT